MDDFKIDYTVDQNKYKIKLDYSEILTDDLNGTCEKKLKAMIRLYKGEDTTHIVFTKLEGEQTFFHHFLKNLYDSQHIKVLKAWAIDFYI